MRPTLYRARWLLPVVTPPLRDGELLVDDAGRIAAVAPSGALNLPEAVEVHDLGDAILLPGLVNVHAHPELAMFRGALEDLPFHDWILRLVSAKRKVLTPDDNAAAARWTLVEAIRGGITTIGATDASGAVVTAMVEAGVRGIVYQEVFGPDPSEHETALDRLQEDLRLLLPQATDLVRIGVSPHAPYTVSDPLYVAAARLARTEGFPMAAHIAESRAERDLVVSGEGDFAPGLRARGIPTPRRGRTPVDLLDRLGVLEAKPLLIHCVDLDWRDIERIAATGCPVAHCPAANAKLGHGIAPVRRLKEAGVLIGLGTDSVGSNNRLDVLEEARISCLLQRASEARPDLLPPEELLRLCTIDGARALGLDGRIGTLEPGKEADLCAVSIQAPHAIPTFDPVATLFHAARGTDVVLTVVRGRALYRSGEIETIDVPAAGAAVERAAERLRRAGV